MTILLAPDKFKGSLTAFEVCRHLEAGIRKVLPQAAVRSFPLADGGDGFAATLQHYWHTHTIAVTTVDPLGRNIRATYEWDATTGTAIIELAAASGLVLLQPQERNPLHTSTYGTGLQIKDALERGARHILLGLGGSATNDAGTGLLAALGFRWLDAHHHELKPCGENLARVAFVEPPATLPRVRLTVACDVNNPLYGPNGAAFVYAPQKGADAAMVQQLDEGLRHLETILNRYTNEPVAQIPGTGAAGGVVAGLLPWLQPQICSGIELLLQASGMEAALPGADLLITGEGRLDSQSLQGKVVGVVAARSRQYNVPVAAVCGVAAVDTAVLQQAGICSMVQLLQPGRTVAGCMARAGVLVSEAAEQLMHAILKN
ncbi:MAG: glycerate kinase [Lacibacter sp.]